MRDKVRPARGFQQLTREKVRPTRLKTAFFGRFGHAGRTFSRRTQPRADFETNDTTAGTDVGQHETANTNARP